MNLDRNSSVTPVLVFVMATLALAFRPPVDARVRQDSNVPVRFTATATNLDPTVRLTATLVDFNITRWSTDAERQRLLGVLVDKGQDKLLHALQDIPRVGTMKTPDTLSYDLHYARQTREGDEDRVVLVTDRAISMWEQADFNRSLQYPFTVIEMRFGPNGQGEGKITVATRIVADPKSGQITLENYGTQPVRLSNVRRETR
jgi:hypothetical protein